MGLILTDGQGTGKTLGIDSDNRARVNSVSQSTEHFINHIKGVAYNLLFSATPSATDDCFLYFKNESETDIVIEGFWLHLEANEYIDIYLDQTGTPIGGSDITPVNLNSGSGKSAEGTFQNGNDITGITGGVKPFRIHHASSQGSTYRNFNQDIVLTKNGVFTMYCETGTTALDGIIVFNYHNPND
ncbi:MAG: hypothetical protein KAS32_14610 [Candidatus Peribacteraceae bacterium]|nr:hypothetical protein [Candidatus Peribacteraceae bacterium]